ncbi:MAG: SGNH/GDSL hydrolase family protein [Nostocaceae cyanobacterium]|nr:SGNH/GDSL hydrolase family protein [Nostocaceae cyanobacterium]
MKHKLVAAGFAIFSVIMPIKAMAASFSQIVGFGDSLLDTGNTSSLTRDAIALGLPLPFPIPPSPPYFNGRFSNGPVWIEQLASGLGLTYNPATNFAIGGATTGTNNTLLDNLIPGLPLPGNPLGLPGLQTQVDSFVTANPQADANALYVIWAGANDYLGDDVTNPAVPVSNLANAVTSLSRVGARNFLVVNLPDLGQLPGTRGNETVSTLLDLLTVGHNAGLADTLNTLGRQPGINITGLDVNSLLRRAVTNPGEFGFTNVTDACLNLTAQTLCSNPNEFLFWDNLHPTTQGHSLIAQAALSSLRSSTSVPEPSTAVGMLALAGLGAAGVLKRQRKKPGFSPKNL